MEFPKIPSAPTPTKSTGRTTKTAPIRAESVKVSSNKEVEEYQVDRRKQRDRRRTKEGVILDSRTGQDRRRGGKSPGINIEV